MLVNQETFSKIYDDYSEMVYNLCLNYFQNQQLAEDTTQEIFISIFEKASKFKGKSSLKTWIYRIAVNHCLDLIKYNNRKKRKAITISLSADKNYQIEPSDINHPGIILEQDEFVKNTFIQINTLPHNQKTAIILKALEELSIKEIAEIMKTSEKAVGSLLSRARKTLKNLITTEAQ